MRIGSRVSALVAVALVSLLLPATTSSASAAGPCGSSYSRVGVYRIPETGTQDGTLEIYYSSSTGKNCALAYGVSAEHKGKRTYKGVAIRRAGGSGGWVGQRDYFKYYAGPVYVSAPGTCIDAMGLMGGDDRYVWNVHCG
ncbi:hypothetical protein [Nonomuraea diastatica]|uniref:Spore-associated protein A n=1 Tax=Nonomuraea diastatica TaxID=1848329 RepID=A0A4R4X542_9ACTN|nr:hypothetical protein [Nonomuraea diastatica]TDD25359.1 hypothetical protein E1294_03560 [Nonomuraea diastatica]